MAFVYEDVKAALDGGRIAFEVWFEFVDEGAEQAGAGVGELSNEVLSGGDAGGGFVFADDACVAHNADDLPIEFVAVGDDQDAAFGVVF